MTRLTLKCLLVFVLLSVSATATGSTLLEKAQKGDANAQFELGLMYASGDGVPKDSTEAVKWYRKAAEQGHARAQYSIGYMYYIGDGVPKDATEAVQWFRKAAEQGNVPAQYGLGLSYARGNGVIQDLVEGHAWINVAGAFGAEGAKESLALCEKLMTREQIAEATKLARERFEKFKRKD